MNDSHGTPVVKFISLIFQSFTDVHIFKIRKIFFIKTRYCRKDLFFDQKTSAANKFCRMVVPVLLEREKSSIKNSNRREQRIKSKLFKKMVKRFYYVSGTYSLNSTRGKDVVKTASGNITVF